MWVVTLAETGIPLPSAADSGTDDGLDRMRGNMNDISSGCTITYPMNKITIKIRVDNITDGSVFYTVSDIDGKHETTGHSLDVDSFKKYISCIPGLKVTTRHQ